MKKIKVIVYFVLLFVLLEGLSIAVMRGNTPNLTYIQERDRGLVSMNGEPEDSLDVVVLGDSESYTSFSPMELWEKTGATSFACGQSGQHMAESYYMLKQVLKRQNPRLVMLETNVFFSYTNLLKETKTALTEASYYFLPILRYHNVWKQPIDSAIEPERNCYQGFTFRTVRAAYTGGAYMTETQERQKIPVLNRVFMDRIVDLCRREGIALLLYSSPSPINYNYAKHNAIADYAEEKDIAYVDLNLHTEEMGLDWSNDTLDQGDHVNHLGMQKVMAYLTGYIQEHYVLEDHREDPAYAKWNTLLQKYQEERAGCP